jgi:hypothetical protein
MLGQSNQTCYIPPMNRSWRGLEAGWRCFIALASLALMLQVLVPSGYMVSQDPLAPGLVICTGHGALLARPGHNDPAKSPKTAPDAPCAFAAHGVALTPPALSRVAEVVIEPSSFAVAQVFYVLPGRGLAAPPPPSTAPPTLTV